MDIDQASPPVRGRRGFASPALVRLLAGLALVFTVTVPIGGIAFAVNGATQAHGYITVPVQVRSIDSLRIPLTEGAGADAEHPLRQSAEISGILLRLPGSSGSNRLEADTGTVMLTAWDSTVVEQLAGRGDVALVGVCAGLGALLLRTLLLSIAARRPFRSGNAARLGAIAGLIMVAAVSTEVFPHVAGDLVLTRLGLGGPDSPVSAPPALSPGLVVPLLISLVVLAFAEGFRQGAEPARDTGEPV
ncbi:hypothetical protein [Streptosporangium sp. 'caverna']|uniref:hypothetical protein n=1 Tax=Streptosporangium sp. 'caverna' TaxID=2202249 RepID=UPI000D7D3A45|nr:hypothetical protein [Streptosporangium sp. 'caverna']AWS43277.1 hypothetical protein DKM19_19745 [Streptosporangium sp. 'caverna']